MRFKKTLQKLALSLLISGFVLYGLKYENYKTQIPNPSQPQNNFNRIPKRKQFERFNFIYRGITRKVFFYMGMSEYNN